MTKCDRCVLQALQPYADQAVWGGRRTAVLQIEREEQLPLAAEAVVGSIYGETSLLDNLSDHELVDAVQLADMLQVGKALQAATIKFKIVAATAEGLSSTAHAQLLQLPGLPEVLQQAFPITTAKLPAADVAELWSRTVVPRYVRSADDVLAAPHSGYVQQRLLEACGDSCNAEQQRNVASTLPTPALVLLLASDQLKVRSNLDVTQLQANCNCSRCALRQRVTQ